MPKALAEYDPQEEPMAYDTSTGLPHLLISPLIPRDKRALLAVAGLLAPVGQLHETPPSLEREGLQLDHSYDF